MIPLYIFIGVVLLFIIWLFVTYNGLIAAQNQTEEALSDIDVQLKRRYDLIPNLIESVKGYIKQEKDVLENITKARSEAISVGSHASPEGQQAENLLTGALRSVFAVAENYPDLKSSANFQQLSGELTDTENKIEASRRFFNANVRDFNTRVEVLPTSIFAKMLGFTQKSLFVLEEEAAKQTPKVQF